MRYMNGTFETIFAISYRWFQVTSSHVAHVPPVVHACETIESKNREIVQMLADPLDQPIQKLSLSLQGVIDAAVNGGIAKYQEAFFSSEFLRDVYGAKLLQQLEHADGKCYYISTFAVALPALH